VERGMTDGCECGLELCTIHCREIRAHSWR
jgi:hypothetical protein